MNSDRKNLDLMVIGIPLFSKINKNSINYQRKFVVIQKDTSDNKIWKFLGSLVPKN